MAWNLFIDDERNLEDVTWAPPQILEKYCAEPWVVARSGQEALDEFIARGMPCYISFDHDLGDYSGSGYDIAKLLIDIDMKTTDSKYSFTEDFSFYVHSKNPVGKANIEGLLNNYLKVKNAGSI